MPTEPIVQTMPLAEFQTPSMRAVRQYLRSIGAVFLGSGKGDHERWKLKDGRIITLNHAKGQNKELDFACLKALAALLGMTIKELSNQM